MKRVRSVTKFTKVQTSKIMIELNVLQYRFFESKLLADRKVQAFHIFFIFYVTEKTKFLCFSQSIAKGKLARAGTLLSMQTLKCRTGKA